MRPRHALAIAIAAATTTLAVASAAAPTRAPAGGEQTSLRLVSTSLLVGEGRRVAVRVRCATRTTCAGTLRLRVGNGTDQHPKRYRVAGRRTTTIRVGITPTAKRKIDGPTFATVTLTERGPEGERSSERRLRIRVAQP